MSRAQTKEAAALPCVACHAPLILPIGRGRSDDEGNEVRHADHCRCRWCDWWWVEDDTPIKCECGAFVAVSCEDGVAMAYETEGT